MQTINLCPSGQISLSKMINITRRYLNVLNTFAAAVSADRNSVKDEATAPSYITPEKQTLMMMMSMMVVFFNPSLLCSRTTRIMTSTRMSKNKAKSMQSTINLKFEDWPSKSKERLITVMEVIIMLIIFRIVKAS